MRQINLFVAVPACRLHFWAHRAAAVLDRVDCVSLAGWQAAAVLLQELGFESLDDAGQPDHLTLPQPIDIRPTSALMRSVALFLVWSVRWV